jgi:hypothetical protein
VSCGSHSSNALIQRPFTQCKERKRERGMYNGETRQNKNKVCVGDKPLMTYYEHALKIVRKRVVINPPQNDNITFLS